METIGIVQSELAHLLDTRQRIYTLASELRNEGFAERPTILEALNYALLVAKASDCSPAVVTAVMIVVNTIAKELLEICDDN